MIVQDDAFNRSRLRTVVAVVLTSNLRLVEAPGNVFVTKKGELLVNELAPRPHNSYHASERGCATSQFEQCVRAICNLPLGSTEVLEPAAIVNLLGDLWLASPHPRFDAALSVPGVGVHLYEKEVPKAGRKMGLRERIIGCGFSAVIVGGVVFLLALIGGLVWTYVLHR